MKLEINCLLSSGDLKRFADSGDLCVLLAYENERLCSHALRLLNRVARTLDAEGNMVCAIWKFDFLIDPFLQQVSASEAALADLVLIAAQDAPELPDAVKDWLSLWLATRMDQPKALAAVLERRKGQPDQGVLGQLQEAARLGGADFFHAVSGAEQSKTSWTPAARVRAALAGFRPRFPTLQSPARAASRLIPRTARS